MYIVQYFTVLVTSVISIRKALELRPFLQNCLINGVFFFFSLYLFPPPPPPPLPLQYVGPDGLFGHCFPSCYCHKSAAACCYCIPASLHCLKTCLLLLLMLPDMHCCAFLCCCCAIHWNHHNTVTCKAASSRLFRDYCAGGGGLYREQEAPQRVVWWTYHGTGAKFLKRSILKKSRYATYEMNL